MKLNKSYHGLSLVGRQNHYDRSHTLKNILKDYFFYLKLVGLIYYALTAIIINFTFCEILLQENTRNLEGGQWAVNETIPLKL